jgi:hypothetical protein
LRTPARGGDWTTPIGGNPAFGLGPTTTGPAVDAGRVYVTLGGRYLRALDPANGATIWSVEGSQLAPVSSTAPTIANGALYHGTQTGTLVARNPATGAVLWSDTTAPHHHGHHRGRGRQRRRLQLPLHRHHRPSPLSGRSGELVAVLRQEPAGPPDRVLDAGTPRLVDVPELDRVLGT